MKLYTVATFFSYINQHSVNIFDRLIDPNETHVDIHSDIALLEHKRDFQSTTKVTWKREHFPDCYISYHVAVSFSKRHNRSYYDLTSTEFDCQYIEERPLPLSIRRRTHKDTFTVNSHQQPTIGMLKSQVYAYTGQFEESAIRQHLVEHQLEWLSKAQGPFFTAYIEGGQLILAKRKGPYHYYYAIFRGGMRVYRFQFAKMDKVANTVRCEKEACLAYFE